MSTIDVPSSSSRSRQVSIPRNDGPPTSETPYGLCARCNTQSSFEQINTTPLTSVEKGRYKVTARNSGTRVVVFHCRNCYQGIIVIEELCMGSRPVSESLGSYSGPISWKGIYWWPLAGVSAPSCVPSEIGKSFMESVQCFHSGCYGASAVMSRRTLEAIIDDNHIPKGNLYKRINELVDLRRLGKEVEEWSHEVRLVGNRGAHYQSIEEVSKKDASALISFIQYLFKSLYELKYELNRRRSKTKKHNLNEKPT